MTGPIHMNQVLYQTPTVEKIQQAEQQSPDNLQRHNTVEELIKLQQRTETVQTAVKTEQSKNLDKDGQGRRKPSRKKISGNHEPPEKDGEQLVDTGKPSGRIVDIVI